jgi:hypothetical protein
LEIRLKIGRYAGEIKDVEAVIAHQLIDDGRATDPRFEGELPAPLSVLVDELHKQPAPVAEVKTQAPRRRRGN